MHQWFFAHFHSLRVHARPPGGTLFVPFGASVLPSGRPRVLTAPLVLGTLLLFVPTDATGAIGLPRSVVADEPARNDVRIVPIPGSKGHVKRWSVAGVSHYAISNNGLTIDWSGPTSYDLLLRYGHFDPLAGEPTVPAELAANEASPVRIVQFVTQPLPEYRDLIRAAGGRIGAYLGNHAFIVRIDPRAIPALAAQPVIRWIGPMHPAYRLEEPLVAEALDPNAGPAAKRLSILGLPREIDGLPADAETLAKSLTDLGAVVHLVVPESGRVEATLTSAQLRQAARLDDVLFIDRWFEPTTYMNSVRADGGANYVESVAGFTGTGVRGEVMDSNLLETHQDFRRNVPILHGARGGSASHGTSVFGIVFGTGTGLAAARGMLPDAQGIFADFGNLTNRPAHIARLNQTPYFAVFQTNSWGSCCTTAYTTAAAEMDGTLFTQDIVLLQAQANSGSVSSDAIAFAKNLVSVGGIRHQNTLSLADDSWTNAGSIGPASDGRIKPDLSYWYDSIHTTASSGAYTTGFGGTSAATPMTAGHFGLFFQMWGAGIFGNPVTPGATVFQNRPHMATSKAMMINSAAAYPFSGAAADLTRTHQGWGRPNVQRLYDRRQQFFIVNEAHVLPNLGSRTEVLTVAPGTPDLRVTLVYADPAGNPASTRHRINNLSLRVVAPDGTAYWGNSGLLAGNTSTSGGTENIVDTVENVWITNPAPGLWSIEVRATEIVQDGHRETPELDADYALVVSGIVPVVPCPADFNDDGLLNPDDLSDYIACYFDGPGCPQANYNSDNNTDPDDLSDFIAAYFTGCP